MKFLALLGMAQAAGRLISGDMACADALERGRVHLLVIAADAADRTQRHFTSMASQVNVPIVVIATKAELGRAIGKPDRAVIGVVDAGFARSLKAAAPGSGN